MCGRRFGAAPLAVFHAFERFPENGAADGETDETGGLRRRGEPVFDLLGVFAATENDDAHVFAAVDASLFRDFAGVGFGFDSFELPDIGFDAGSFYAQAGNVYTLYSDASMTAQVARVTVT